VERYCPLIQRFGPEAGSNAGQINQIYLPTTNLGRIDVQGVDMQVNYRLPDFGLGQFTVGLNATYMKQFKIQLAPDVPAANRVINGAGAMGSTGTALQSACPFNLGGICFFPRVRAQTSVDWQLGPWDASWRTRISSPFQIGSDDPSQQSTAIAGIPGVILHYGTYVYNDLTIGYSIQPINTRISVGVDNMFDKQPPMLYANNSLNANTDPEDFDVIGRYYWARLNVKF
jgi:outer membrane receptor protein involved in Fe transport